MNRGRREETFLKKGFLSPPPDPLLSPSQDFRRYRIPVRREWESLKPFFVRRILEKHPGAIALRDVYFFRRRKTWGEAVLLVIQRNSRRAASPPVESLWGGKGEGRAALAVWRGKEGRLSPLWGFLQKGPPFPLQLHTTDSLRSWGCRGHRQRPCHKRDRPWSNCRCDGSEFPGAHRP